MMDIQLSFVGDGKMAFGAGWQEGHSFVWIYDTGEPHDLDVRLPQPFSSTEELVDKSQVILNFTNAKSIDNLIDTLNDAKSMLEDIEAFAKDNVCDIVGGDDHE